MNNGIVLQSYTFLLLPTKFVVFKFCFAKRLESDLHGEERTRITCTINLTFTNATNKNTDFLHLRGKNGSGSLSNLTFSNNNQSTAFFHVGLNTIYTLITYNGFLLKVITWPEALFVSDDSLVQEKLFT